MQNTDFKNPSLIILAAMVLFVPLSTVAAELKPAMIFSDNMVLQRNKPIRVWGQAKPGQLVSVSLGRNSRGGKVKEDGTWRIELPPMRVDDKSHKLRIKSDKQIIEFKNVQIGEVWFLAGQSNMAAGMGRPGDALPGLRLMSIDHNRVYGWHVATPDNVTNMPWADGSKRWRSVSYVAYHFGRHLHEHLKIPVGVMHADHGGSIIAAWMTDTVKNDWPELPGGKPVEGNLAVLPGNLYRYKVKKAAPLNIGGVIWWQGESDGKNVNYAKDLQSMIATWRELFEQPELPFIAIQIAPNTYGGGPLLIWEAQTWATKHIRNFYLAPNQDAWVGQSKGIDSNTGWPTSGGNPHPPAKDQAARRAADIARSIIGDEVKKEVFGPMYESFEIKENKIFLKFEHVGDGLKTRDDEPPTWFEISDGASSGNDIRYVKAEAAIIAKDTIAVYAEGITDPQYVRYGWSAISMTNLVNSSGLPAISFRTDPKTD